MEIEAHQFVGRWHASHGALSCDWTLRTDRTFIAELSRGKRVFSRPTGRWRVQEEYLVSDYLDDEFGEIGSSFPDCDKITEVAADYFILLTSTGLRKYQRIS